MTTDSYTIKYDDTAVKIMIYPAVLFLVLGMSFGVFLAFNTFVFPDYYAGEYMHFGRVRPVHLFNVLWLWLLSGDIGLFYFIVPRLCGVPLWSTRLAVVTASIWWFALIVITYAFPLGYNSGWEYAEHPFWIGWIPAKFLVVVAWVLMCVNIFMTIATRRFQKMYVSLWYVMGTCIWTLLTALVGFFFIYYVPGGISRMNTSFYYVHNIVGLTFTPAGLAIAYYFIPKISNTPIYSHRLSMIGFWSIAFTYAWIGSHHMMHGPISQWLQTVAIVFSIWLFIPVFTVIHNFFWTLKGKWQEFNVSVPIRFLMLGTVFYLMTCIQGPLEALRNVNEVTSKTDYVIAHSHISLFGTFTYFSIPGIYYATQVITGKPLWSESMARWHFSLSLFGTFFFFAALFVGGFLQGLMWASWANGTTYAQFHANLSHLPFLQTVAEMRFWWILRGIGGLIILLANILFAINIFNTVVLKARDVPTDLNAEPTTV